MNTEVAQDTLPLHAPGILEALEALRAATTEAQREENEAARLHWKKELDLDKAVQAYNNERLASILREFAQRKLAWCTVCKSIKPQSETTLMLSEGRYEYSCGYEGGDYAAREYENLHNACASCRERWKEKHGKRWKAQYGSEEYFYAFPVEKRDESYWVDRFGWRKLVRKESWEKPYEVPGTPEEVFELLALEWKLPPALQIKHCPINGCTVGEEGAEEEN